MRRPNARRERSGLDHNHGVAHRDDSWAEVIASGVLRESAALATLQDGLGTLFRHEVSSDEHGMHASPKATI